MKNIFKHKTLQKFVSILITYAAIQGLITVGIIDDYWQATLATICINIILAVSLNLITGFTGQFSLGHAGFMSIGAYVCAIITISNPTTVGFIGGIIAGAIAAALVGAIVGLPTLRLRGDYLAIATLGMAEIIKIIFLNMEITNGAAGLQGIPQFVNWTWMFVFTVGTVVIIANFLKSSHGRACISIREDEIAAESMGVNTTKYKVISFTMGAFFAGIAGGIYASYFYFLKPDLFGFLKSVDVLVIVVLGGLGSISGSIIAAVLLAIISTFLQSFSEVRMIIYALLLIILMLFRPQGLMGSKEISLSVFKKIGLKSKRGKEEV
ncbi:branched-chain amino acid ABC transporter permease [Ruminiclostridium cellobioparum]|uniref:ABC-type branched-chain amino acid transport system, permease component n=1 Tax=Ruminiclostridium cellobioparum subsp. termitidis CT1112 TaxID=1195236 RepID=S0FPK9_RUMCE|nr:branched-chain amino acid ABC transporter permease [Ruminiclostridium cellobioparum]EMS71114.1 ABC-type branched-chain amino acid transport system, permease component [Ruminiclostridium cellobioparum subsp. termitidis CT1112]